MRVLSSRSISTFLERPGITGNPDFYGLGIRLGVYLQIVSTWVTNTLNPEAAADNHNANSIFMFAVLVAVLQAANNDSGLHPIEAWIMLQICFAFLLTVMGIFGLRMRFLLPSSVASLIYRWKRTNWQGLFSFIHNQTLQVDAFLSPFGMRSDVLDFIKTVRTKFGNRGLGHLANMTRRYATTMSFQAVSEALKHESLSWSGALWRTAIATILCSANLWYWFGYLGANQPPTCRPKVFFFGQLQLDGGLVTFFQAAAIIISAPVLFLMYVAVTLTAALGRLVYFNVMRYTVLSILGEGFWGDETLAVRQCLAEISALATFAFKHLLGVTGMFYSLISSPLNQELWMKGRECLPTLADVAKAYIVFATKGRDSAEDSKNKEAESELEVRTLHRALCAAFHAWTGLAIVWFILSIELTIRWNNISGVFDLSSTGQLIPFVIGATSFVQALQQISLVLLKRKFRDWESIDYNITLTTFGEGNIELVKRRNETMSPTGLQDSSGKWH